MVGGTGSIPYVIQYSFLQLVPNSRFEAIGCQPYVQLLPDYQCLKYQRRSDVLILEHQVAAFNAQAAVFLANGDNAIIVCEHGDALGFRPWADTGISAEQAPTPGREVI